ncbi:MAG: LptA/OstA family protein [Pseudomonadota bacterium]
MIILRLILITFSLFCSSQIAFAASNKIITTKITANFIDIKRKSQTVNLIGNVIVEREDLSIKADNMLVYYYDKSSQQNDAEQGDTIKKIEAKDNVKIFNGEFIATGKYGFYNPAQNNVILEKDVIFNNGTSIANGQRFVYDLKTKKGNLVGEKNLSIENQTVKNKQNNPDVQTDAKTDGRVVVIIDDNDFKKSNPKSNKK